MAKKASLQLRASQRVLKVYRECSKGHADWKLKVHPQKVLQSLILQHNFTYTTYIIMLNLNNGKLKYSISINFYGFWSFLWFPAPPYSSAMASLIVIILWISLYPKIYRFIDPKTSRCLVSAHEIFLVRFDVDRPLFYWGTLLTSYISSLFEPGSFLSSFYPKIISSTFHW